MFAFLETGNVLFISLNIVFLITKLENMFELAPVNKNKTCHKEKEILTFNIKQRKYITKSNYEQYSHRMF